MVRRFSNLAVLCIALAAAGGMLVWVATTAINLLLESPDGGSADVNVLRPATENRSNRN